MKKLLILLFSTLLVFTFAACSESDETKPEQEETKVEESNNSEETEEESEEETVEEPLKWEKQTVGPMEFEAPLSWKVSDSAYYSPPAPIEGDYSGYSMSVFFNENRNGNIEFFVDRDLEQYDDVDLDYIDVLGYDAARLQYEYNDDGDNTFNTVYYIQIYPESGLGIISYEAPASEPDLYREDFEKLFYSLSIDGSQKQKEINESSFVLNTSTGTFHRPSCYKVKQIENAETVTGTFDEMISKGYKGCELCNPK